MLNLTSTITEVLTLVWRMLVPTLMLNLTSTIPEVLTLVWRISDPYLDVDLDLHNTRGPDPCVEAVSPMPWCWTLPPQYQKSGPWPWCWPWPPQYQRSWPWCGGCESHTLMLNLKFTIPKVLILLWTKLVPYLDVELDLHNTRGPDPGVEDVSPIPWCWTWPPQYQRSWPWCGGCPLLLGCRSSVLISARCPENTWQRNFLFPKWN